MFDQSILTRLDLLLPNISTTQLKRIKISSSTRQSKFGDSTKLQQESGSKSKIWSFGQVSEKMYLLRMNHDCMR